MPGAVAECCGESCLERTDRAVRKPGGAALARAAATQSDSHMSGTESWWLSHQTTGGVVGGTRRPLPCSVGSTSCVTAIGGVGRGRGGWDWHSLQSQSLLYYCDLCDLFEEGWLPQVPSGCSEEGYSPDSVGYKDKTYGVADPTRQSSDKSQ